MIVDNGTQRLAMNIIESHSLAERDLQIVQLADVPQGL